MRDSEFERARPRSGAAVPRFLDGCGAGERSRPRRPARPQIPVALDETRTAGARISLIRDGDVAASIACARPQTDIDVLLGIGGSPEAVLSAAALVCMDGEIQCKLWPRDETVTQ